MSNPFLLFPVGLVLIFSIAMCVHVVRSGREIYWLFIILFFQPIGGLVYAALFVIPDLFGGAAARRIGSTARSMLDPDREYRAARQAVEETPTVGARLRLAHAAEALGRFDEAERQFAQAEVGIHTDDPALLLGRARSLIELKRPAEALTQLERLTRLNDVGSAPQTALALGRAYHMLGRDAEADAAFQRAVERMPGLEAMARYTVFLAQTGRRQQAQETFAEIEKRAAAAPAHFRKEARGWRELAAAGLR